MEPVPEAESLEEFRSAPLPSVRLQSSPPFTFASPTPLSPRRAVDPDGYLRKPPSSASSSRRSTELPSSPASPSWSTVNALPYRPRTASPLSGYHTRSRSTASPGGFIPQGMARTRSMPGVTGSGHLQYGPDFRSSSPARQHRPPSLSTRTPKKAVMEDVFPSSPTRVSVLNDSDRRLLHERNSSPNLKGGDISASSTSSSTLTAATAPVMAVPMAVATFPLVRSRRPSSPYRRLSSAGSAGSSGSSGPPPSSSSPLLNYATLTPSSNPIMDAISPIIAPMASLPESSLSSVTSSSGASSSSTASSPSYRPLDAPQLTSYGSGGSSISASSVPSTPTSTRSRSPSISSLETIPDSPDAEEAALEAERIAQLKAEAEAAEGGEPKGRSSLDVPMRGRTMGFGSRDKRKRWSVCGAERRGDLDLETIWED